MRAALAALLAVALGIAAAPARAAAPPPDPWPLLHPGEPRTPPLEAPYRDLCTTPERVETALEPARRAVTRDDRMRAREALAPLAARGEDEIVRGCAALASARLALALGLLPEAAADALWAAQQAETLGDARLLDAARFARAEALAAAGRGAASRKLYDPLFASADPVLAAAARLRMAESQQDRGDTAAALATYRTLLGPGSPLAGVPLGAFALRAAEAAWAVGDAGEAARWVEQALGERLDPAHWTAAMIRRADLQLAAGRDAEALRTYDAVASFAPDDPAAHLVAVRRVAHALRAGEVDAAALRARLAPAAAASMLPLASYARAVEVELSLTGAEERTAFADLVPLLTERRSVERLGLAATLDRVVLDVIGKGDHCEAALAVLDPQRALLVRSVASAAPLVALGECYRVVGLVDPALAVLRAATERFGPEATALPLARAALRAGLHDVAASAARDRVAAGATDVGAWRLLLAEVELARDDPRSAEALLLPLVGEGRGAQAIGLLAKAAGRGEPSGVALDVLERSVASADESAWREDAATLGDAAVRTANLLRRAGHAQRAALLYGLATEHASGPAARAEAFYWLARLSPEREATRHRLDQSAAAGDGVWSELAKSRLALLDLGRRPMGRPQS